MRRRVLGTKGMSCRTGRLCGGQSLRDGYTGFTVGRTMFGGSFCLGLEGGAEVSVHGGEAGFGGCGSQAQAFDEDGFLDGATLLQKAGGGGAVASGGGGDDALRAVE